ncbi:MAG: hypothetical protein ACR2HJ_01840 [Fimbriimonadales bacterium]
MIIDANGSAVEVSPNGRKKAFRGWPEEFRRGYRLLQQNHGGSGFARIIGKSKTTLFAHDLTAYAIVARGVQRSKLIGERVYGNTNARCVVSPGWLWYAAEVDGKAKLGRWDGVHHDILNLPERSAHRLLQVSGGVAIIPIEAKNQLSTAYFAADRGPIRVVKIGSFPGQISTGKSLVSLPGRLFLLTKANRIAEFRVPVR